MTDATPLHQLTVKEIMNSHVLCVYEGWSIARLAQFFLKHNISAAPVIASDHELVGVVCASDIFRFEKGNESHKSEIVRACYRNATGLEIHDAVELTEWTAHADKYCTVHQIMDEEIINVDQQQTVAQAIDMLLKHDVQRLFVTTFGVIVGIVTATDLLKLLRDGKKQG